MVRQRTNPLEDLIAIASRFPWWISALLVPISYLVLYSIVIRLIMPSALSPGQMGDAVATGFVTTLCMFGQFILPFAFSLAAIISWVRSIKQRKLYETVKSRSDVAVLNEMAGKILKCWLVSISEGRDFRSVTSRAKSGEFSRGISGGTRGFVPGC